MVNHFLCITAPLPNGVGLIFGFSSGFWAKELKLQNKKIKINIIFLSLNIVSTVLIDKHKK